jgi:hypothetical protein
MILIITYDIQVCFTVLASVLSVYAFALPRLWFSESNTCVAVAVAVGGLGAVAVAVGVIGGVAVAGWQWRRMAVRMVLKSAESGVY